MITTLAATFPRAVLHLNMCENESEETRCLLQWKMVIISILGKHETRDLATALQLYFQPMMMLIIYISHIIVLSALTTSRRHERNMN